MKKEKTIKITAFALAAAMLIGAAGVITCGAGTNGEENTEEKVYETISSVIDKERSIGKEETVYVLADADGSVKKVIVSDWLKNPDGKVKISDKTELEDISNVKGSETYSVNSGNLCVWDAQGKDIYYQGTTQKKLPVDIAVSYTLDGSPISAGELAGKSGRVTMRFDYKNNQKQTVELEGKKETLYVPFVMVTGMLLDNAVFKNIKVSNGKLINDGERSIVMGFALPGMQENLNIAKEAFEIPNYVEISADVQNFTLTTTLTIAGNEMFNGLNLEQVDSLENLTEALGALQEASSQLVDGSSELYDGLSALLEKSGELISGIDELDTAAKQVREGAKTLSGGTAELNSGLGELNIGLKNLAANSNSLTGGAKQIFESLLSMADGQLKAAGFNVPKLTIENYKSVLNGVLGSLDKEAVYKLAYNTAKAKVTESVQMQEAQIRAQVKAGVQKQVLEAVLAAAGQQMKAEQYQAAVESGMISEEMQTQINAAAEAQMNSEQIREQIISVTASKIKELIESSMKSETVQSQIAAAAAQAEAGAGSIQSLLAQLDSYQEFYNGVASYTGGVNQAYEGSKQLVSGAAQLKTGAASLSEGTAALADGVGTLKSGSSALTDGVSQLQEGSMQLSEGMKEFNESGIEKLAKAFDGDISGLVNRLKAAVGISKDYQSFAGIAEGMEGSVKFIYRTDSIGE